MPISQDRLIALIDVADLVIEAHSRLAATAAAELDEALNEFYSADGNSNPLASAILARLQMLSMLISESGLPASSIETLAREREHFRVRRTLNVAARRSMQRQRRIKREEGIPL